MPRRSRCRCWLVPFAGGEPKSLGEGDLPAGLAARRRRRLRARTGQLWSVPIDGSCRRRRLFTARGEQRRARSGRPTARALAFVSNRGDHALVGVFTRRGDADRLDRAEHVARLEPALVARRHRACAFVRRPGAGGARRRWSSSGGTSPGRSGRPTPRPARRAGCGERPRRLSRLLPDDRTARRTCTGPLAAASSSSRYADGWPHLYSIPPTGGEPLLLTPGAFMAEHVRLSPDRRCLVFAANAGADARRRRPAPRACGSRSAGRAGGPDARAPASSGARSSRATARGSPTWLPTPQPPAASGGPSGAGRRRACAGRGPRARGLPDRPARRRRSPSPTRPRTASRSTPSSSSGRAARRRSRRSSTCTAARRGRCCSAGTTPSYYANAYAMNQYLASRGFVVLSVNYRLGIGYGYEFHRPPDAGAQGAASTTTSRRRRRYLRALPAGRPVARSAIYGGSYGGYLDARSRSPATPSCSPRASTSTASTTSRPGRRRRGARRPRTAGSSAVRAERPRAGARAWRGSRRRSPRSTPGARRCCSSTATTTATCASARRSTSRGGSGEQGARYEELVIVDDTTTSCATRTSSG